MDSKLYKEYYNLNNSQLSYVLRKLYFKDLNQFNDIITTFKKSERYELDYIFRIITEAEEIAYWIVLGEYDNYINTIDTLYARLKKANKSCDLLPIYHIVANAYSKINQNNMSIDCYMYIIKHEKNKKQSLFSAIANHNIGHLYRMNGDNDTALAYSFKARKMIDEFPNGDLEHDSFWVFNTAEISILYLEKNDLKNSNHYYKLCKTHLPNEMINLSEASFKEVEMRYHFQKRDLTTLKKVYQKIKQKLINDNDYPTLASYALTYYNFNIKLNVKISELIDEIKEIQEYTKDKATYKDERNILMIIINYHLENNEPQAAKPYIERLVHKFKYYDLQLQELNSKIIDISSEKIEYKKNSLQMLSHREKLQEHYNENLKKNQYIKEVCERLKIIQNLGNDIMLSTNLKELASKICNNLNNFSDINNFTLLSIDRQNNQLKTEFIYDIYNDDNAYTLDINKNNNIQEFLKLKKVLKIDNLYDEPRVTNFLCTINAKYTMYKSAVIAPIIFNDEVIAIVFCLSIKINAFEFLSMELINQISIFIAIAINNLNRKQNLIKIIEEHKNTKEHLKKLNQYSKDLSHKDKLTKVHNRRAFDIFYQNILSQKIKNKKSITVYMMDIDHFKDYNDTFGHLKGDDILKKVARKLNIHFKNSGEFFARYGGEEFIAISNFNNEENKQKSLEKAETLRTAIEKMKIPHPNSECGILTISIGVACINKPSENNNIYIKLSDKALYQAKSAGRNCVNQIILNS